MINKDKLNKFLDRCEKPILVLIALNLVMFILDTMQSFHDRFYNFYQLFELVSVIIFTIEYLLRLLAMNKFVEVFKPMMLIDLAAVLPYYLSFITVNTLFLRIFRLSKILRILKINRYTRAMDNIINAFKSKKEELIITFTIFFSGILLSSVLLYFVENSAQPEVFSSIPKTFYFTVATFTSVGYGDVTAVTLPGQIISCIAAILGVGLHGLFVGIIGTAFMKAFNKDKDSLIAEIEEKRRGKKF